MITIANNELTLAVGIMIVIFRRIPAIFMAYRFMPNCVVDWKEALFMGYFGPIGIGAVCLPSPTFYLRQPVLAQPAPYPTVSSLY